MIAGAGTGKTSVVSSRIAHAIAHGVDPNRILLVTFTRQAAGEVAARAQSIVTSAAGFSQIAHSPRFQFRYLIPKSLALLSILLLQFFVLERYLQSQNASFFLLNLLLHFKIVHLILHSEL